MVRRLARGGSAIGGKGGNRDIPNAGTYYEFRTCATRFIRLATRHHFVGEGGEARWIGNEAGWAGETNWSMGRGEYGNENDWRWFPGKAIAKATTKGWFWHEGEGSHSAERLFQMYLETVGPNVYADSEPAARQKWLPAAKYG